MNSVSIRRVWERRGLSGKLLWLLLLPVSTIYSGVIRFRNTLYSLGWLKSEALPRPVISIGNLTVGGTGKTPTCLWLAQELAKRGLRVGILSRGYRRNQTTPVILQPKSEDGESPGSELAVLQAGDEPLMMARLYGQTVGVAKNRQHAAKELLRNGDLDVFILDDGFQHRRLKRDVDLLLLGNDSAGWVLPAGPFREPRRGLGRADWYLITGAEADWQSLLPADGAKRRFFGSLQAVGLIGFSGNRWREFPLSLLNRNKILTVAGIADPRGLYRMIHEWEGEIVETLEFPDHYHYSSRDWQQINRMARLVDLIVTTEKDIVKLVRFPFAKDKLLALRVVMAVHNGDLMVEAIIDKIRRHIAPTN